MFHLFKYHYRSVIIRWRSTIATVLGLALVIAVFVLIQSLAVGIEKSSGNTGDPRNLLVTRQGALAETTSVVTREQFNIIRYLPAVARDTTGTPLASGDVLVIINLPRRDGTGNANVMLRGVAPAGRELRPQVALVEGRWFEPGRREVVASRRLADRFANLHVGGRFKTGGVELTVVGIFDAQRSAFDSELWLDSDEARSAFDRPDYSSMLVRQADGAALAQIQKTLEADRRLKMKVVREVDYYKEQTRTSRPIKWLGNGLAIVMSIGALFAAMNTLYASVGARTREIGTLRVLGFRRRSILLGFLLEGALISGFGGALGCAIAYFGWNGYSTGTLGWETFTEVVFDFQITPALVAQGILFAVVVGLIGSLLPALRAARLPVIASLKSV
ncbi:MAG TPA: ABC transporter permease [Opitutaceae bacterium]|nr:ABC transporter permease [Opitutaceae bacterium]